MKKALITGITGMDGSHLADFLLVQGYEVYGIERRTSSKNRVNIGHLIDKITILTADLLDEHSLLHCLRDVNPDEIYNLAAQSFVAESWKSPMLTSQTTGLGVLRLLEAIREYGNPVKYYQASTSEMFGRMEKFASEQTKFYPRSPYGVSKLYAHWMTINYRESYDMFNVCGILFNHESERRGIEFVTRKITDGVARIHLGLQDKIILGNIDTKRDWGYAPDYVKAMWLMLQNETPTDYVVGTGKVHSLREFLTAAFLEIGITDWSSYVGKDERFMRPADVFYLAADASKIRENIGWEPETSFKTMVSKMVKNDINLLESK
jgi:GDPmannose 4,6-dehydratase